MTVDIIHVLLVTLISSNNQTKIEIGLVLLSTKRIHNMADSVSMCILIQSSCFHSPIVRECYLEYMVNFVLSKEYIQCIIP